MGQYWTIINIDKRQTLGHEGKLGEWFFGSPNTLVDYLAVPPLTTVAPTHSVFVPSITGSWAGDRLICVGDSGDDVPKGIFNDDETREFARMTQRETLGDIDPDGEDDEYEQYDLDYIDLYEVAGEYFEENRMIRFERDGFANDKVYILRNLTKREYVRHDAIMIYRDEFEGPYLINSVRGDRPGLGEVLLSRICWSSSTSASMMYDYEGIGITRGAWSGDRFDIQMIDIIEDSANWKDVSKEVVEKLFEIWTAQWEGESWKTNGREEDSESEE
ncbi:hypothetical protein BDZ94DRAFT_1255563 [Collybia nuda]|uniref:Uncharacterized protein n=1 Tax=Collybia nuda TaxID=64659 RepID=A0A9P6CK25_9AGAR|nr:hypothetical protein BDZ94DRAFT_1255563 [Collybia nuda]